nr:conotoxin precursor I1 [Conus ebraeus]UMA82746.1 conotoxin precursor I1 [Conus ebraeus]DAZ86160.1 TPA_inf: conotoxin precursor I1 [Conus ebraeus]
MKLCVTFLLLLVILPTVTGEKSSERTLSGAKGDRRRCVTVGERCEQFSNCCGGMCCVGDRCVMTGFPCVF